MSDITIIKVDVNHWLDYKYIRLEALKKEPLAFSSSYEESIDKPDAKWMSELSNPAFITLLAYDNKKPISMVTIGFETRVKMKHRANIYGVYLNADYRGKKIGKKLLQEALNYIYRNPEIKKINLSVNAEQIPAKKLYESLGFKSIGVLKNDLKINGKYYDEIMMEKLL